MKTYTGANNAAATERQALREMRERHGIKRYIRVQRCVKCGTLNVLLNPITRVCLACNVRGI